MPTPATTDHERGVPSWPTWRLLYSLWTSAADWRTRGSIVRMTAGQLRDRLRGRLTGR